MRRAKILIAIIALAVAAAAQTVPPPPPPQNAAPAAPATPPSGKVTPATPAPPARPRSRTQVYRVAPAVAGSSGSYLGVDVRDVEPERVAALKLKNDQGVEITMVDQDGPAGKAGLKEHDVVVSYNGQAVQSAEQLRRMIRETKPGVSVALGIVRDGQSSTINVALGDRAKLYPNTSAKVWHMESPGNMIVRIPDIDVPSFVMTQSSRRNGVTVENLTAQLGDYFGVKNGEGVLVRSVEKGSRAEAAGLKAGDVILRVDSERVSDTRDWSRLLRNHEAGTVKLSIMRDRREQTLSLAVPESKSEDSFVFPGMSGPDMEQMRIQLEHMGPQFAREQADVQARIAKEMAAHQKEIQQAMREAQREIERSMRELERDRESDVRDAQREKEHALRDAQREKERALREKQREKQKDDEE